MEFSVMLKTYLLKHHMCVLSTRATDKNQGFVDHNAPCFSANEKELPT
jgi:hypothetical protein